MQFGIHHIVMFSQAFIIIMLLFVSISVLLLGGRPFFGECEISVGTKVLFLVALAATVFLGIRRETYLPFLGPAVMPPEVLKEISSPDGATVLVNVVVNAVDGTKIVYWAAQSGKGEVMQDPWVAYTGFKNAGVAIVKAGKATLKINCPTEYRAGGRKLHKHVHYRLCHANGMTGPVETAFVTC